MSYFKCNLKPKRKKATPVLGDPSRPGSGLGVLIDLGEYDTLGMGPGTGVNPGVGEETPISRRRSYMNMSSMFSEGGRRHSFSCVPNSSSLSQSSLPVVKSQYMSSFDGVRRGSLEGSGGDSIMGISNIGGNIGNLGSSSSSVKLSENPMKMKKSSVISSPNSPTPTPAPSTKGLSNTHAFGGGNIPGPGVGPGRQSSFIKIRNRMHFDSSETRSKKIKRKREMKKKRKVE